MSRAASNASDRARDEGAARAIRRLFARARIAAGMILRLTDRGSWVEEEAVLATYMHALGMLDDSAVIQAPQMLDAAE